MSQHMITMHCRKSSINMWFYRWLQKIPEIWLFKLYSTGFCWAIEIKISLLKNLSGLKPDYHTATSYQNSLYNLSTSQIYDEYAVSIQFLHWKSHFQLFDVLFPNPQAIHHWCYHFICKLNQRQRQRVG